MRTVDILAEVSSLFADKTNWGRGQLSALDGATQKNCFCAMGGVMKEGGVLVESWNDTSGCSHFSAASGVSVGPTAGIAGVRDDNNKFTYGEDILSLPSSFFSGLERRGVHLKATINALKYLEAAINALSLKKKLSYCGIWIPIWKANDIYGYGFIMEALALATRNARRRHVNGDRKKANVQSVAQ